MREGQGALANTITAGIGLALIVISVLVFLGRARTWDVSHGELLALTQRKSLDPALAGSMVRVVGLPVPMMGSDKPMTIESPDGLFILLCPPETEFTASPDSWAETFEWIEAKKRGISILYHVETVPGRADRIVEVTGTLGFFRGDNARLAEYKEIPRIYVDARATAPQHVALLPIVVGVAGLLVLFIGMALRWRAGDVG